jgi:predicted DsbA family dithiol-disulfide isomerase
LAAWPALEAARAELGDGAVELMLAPILNGFPMGVPAEHERWFYTRGTRAYDMTLRVDWYEDSRTTTLWANAAAVAASLLGADLATSTRAAMRAAMEEGALLGRRDVAVDTIARATGVDAHALDRLIDSADVGRALNDGNATLARWQCNERPSWRLENANGDCVTMQGVWHKDAILSCIAALKADERAYAEAGAPPF